MPDDPVCQLRVLITAGPTQEPIDAVRYLSNRSSGRMGLALAKEAANRIAPPGRTTLLLGPTTLSPPVSSRFQTIRFRTTGELKKLLREAWPEHDVLIMAAAVADYQPVDPLPEGKMKRNEGEITLRLRPTPDLLASLAELTRPDQTVIGFALEPAETLEEAARKKLSKKNLDAIVANPLETMDSDSIRATIYLKSGKTLDPGSELPKDRFASWLLDQIPAIRGG